MKYFVFAIFSIENIQATHYGIPHDMEGEAINVEDLPVLEPDSNTTTEAYPFLPSDWE